MSGGGKKHTHKEMREKRRETGRQGEGEREEKRKKLISGNQGLKGGGKRMT